jgi:hypothetical protein
MESQTKTPRIALVVLMAGKGMRFRSLRQLGHKWELRPPWIARSLLYLSVSELKKSVPNASLLLVAKNKQHLISDIRTALGEEIIPDGIVILEDFKPGPLASALAAWDGLSLNSFDEIWFATCDTYVPRFILPTNLAVGGTVICFDFDDENLCHVDLTKRGQVSALREKSGLPGNVSSSGVFRIGDCAAFRRVSKAIVKKGAAVLGKEFFISDAINELLKEGFSFDSLILPGGWPLGTPEDIAKCPQATIDEIQKLC